MNRVTAAANVARVKIPKDCKFFKNQTFSSVINKHNHIENPTAATERRLREFKEWQLQ
jgi:hypothetical protein